jgi:hypothetical protein
MAEQLKGRGRYGALDCIVQRDAYRPHGNSGHND